MKDEIKISLRPVQTKRASEEIYEQIKQLIIKGEIHPGERLPSERKMMDMMHRSRPTIREAMRMLERDGYIKIYSGSSGAVVQELNVDNAVQSLETIMQLQKLTMENVLEFRQMTETVAAKLAARRRSTEDLKKMNEILCKAEESVRETSNDMEAFVEYDLQFHLALAAATGNVMYIIMMQVCRNIMSEALRGLVEIGSEEEKKQRVQKIMEKHRRIYQAILDKQEQQAFEETEAHLVEAGSDILHGIIK